MLPGQRRGLSGDSRRDAHRAHLPTLGLSVSPQPHVHTSSLPLQVSRTLAEDGASARSPACTHVHFKQIPGRLFSVSSRDLRENYCRNPDGREFPWCFTTDPRVQTMFCTNIPQCGTQNNPVSGERLESFISHSRRER